MENIKERLRKFGGFFTCYFIALSENDVTVDAFSKDLLDHFQTHIPQKTSWISTFTVSHSNSTSEHKEILAVDYNMSAEVGRNDIAGGECDASFLEIPIGSESYGEEVKM